jgi:hypothetical protein
VPKICAELAAARSESGPVIVVFVDRNGKYFTDYDSPRIKILMAKVLSLLSRYAPLDRFIVSFLFLI